MKDQILKIAGVKTEKEFYKKYPTEEAFMKVHGKKLEKLAMGKAMVNKQLEQLTDWDNPKEAQWGELLGKIAGGSATGGGGFDLMQGLGSLATKAKDATGAATTAAGSGGLGNLVGDLFNKKGGGAKGIMDASQNMFKGQGLGGLKQLGTKQGLGTAGKAAGLGLLNSATDIIGGFGQMNQQKNTIKKAETARDVSGLVKQAATNKPVEIQKHNFVRPEDSLTNPGELGAPQGTGSNFLQMRSGGEIQNTYAPYTLYDDLAYEPIKQYEYGGPIPEAEFGDYFQSSGQASIGKGVGSAIGGIFGPAGSAIGGVLGSVVGNLFGGAADANKLKRLQGETERNTKETAYAQNFGNLQSQNAAFMEEGGWVSNDWQPQVIATFGEHKMSDLLKADPMMNTLRSGGHLAQVGYTAPSMRALETAQNGSVLDSAIRSKTDLQSITDNGAFSQNLRHAISSTDTYADGRPVEKTDLYSITKGHGDNQRVKEFLRSQVGDEAPQYSMQKTYKPLFSDKYKTVSKTIGAGRGERRMADMENFLAEGKMEDGGYMAMGGNLQTHWGGHPELMSYNPYIPGGGETVMFRGQSHDDTNGKGQSGIGITYGDNPVEVERGEPMTEMNDGGVVYGNMVIDQFAADQINDPKAKGKKYKNYVADLSKTEAKQNKILDKASELALDKNVNNAFDQLSLNASQANIIGANMKLKEIADKKLNAAAVQNAILETAEEHGLQSDALAKGQIKKAKLGASIDKAAGGFGPMIAAKNKKDKAKTQAHRKATSAPKSVVPQVYMPGGYATDYDLPENFTPGITPLGDSTGKRKQGVMDAINQRLNFTQPTNNIDVPFQEGYKAPAEVTPRPTVPSQFATSNITGVDIFGNYTGPQEATTEDQSNEKEGFNWGDLANSAMSNLAPLLRPSNQMPLDPGQLYPEMFALASNQLEPVQAQKYQPNLQGAPSDISYQDQLNEITAQSRAAERMSQYNPEAAANLFAQASKAKTNVLAEQFRANQARKEQVYAENRNALNQAQMQNLQILDNQYVRQAQAKSNTKEQALKALESIADKTAKNKLENRTMGVYENLYKYRFDDKGRAFNYNEPYQFNIPDVGNIESLTEAQKGKVKDLYEKIVSKDKAGNITGSKEKTSTSKTSRNGSIVKAIKNL